MSELKVYNFMGIRKIAVVLSAIMLVVSIASLSINGLVLGLDFSGGTQVEVGYEKPADVGELR
ncbi:MAG: protein translocase subunit SecF, partial [Porticoccaceae bacterium]